MTYRFIRYLILYLILIPFYSCNSSFDTSDKRALARVYDSYLYYEDVVKTIPNSFNKNDSLQWIEKYIDNWVNKQLILRKAELNLTEKQKDVEKELLDYRTTLIIHRFKENIIKQRLDTVITQQDIETYYEEFQSEFRLKQDYVKTIYVKIPKSTPDFIKIRQWYRSEKEEDLNDLEDYCFQNGLEFNFDITWESFNSVLSKINYNVRSNKDFLKRNHFIEKRDSVYRYYMNIKKYKLTNDIAPVSIVSNDIKKIIINKRKIDLLKEVENSVIKEVRDKNIVEKFN